MRTQETFDRAEATSLITTSNSLLLKAQWPRLTINEQRLVLYMLALIDKDDEDFKTYKISVRELGNILGTGNKDLYHDFDRATDGLMSKVIRWIEPEFKDLVKVTWCSSARLAPGRGFVSMTFDPQLKPFLLTLKGNFTSYELRAVIRLKNHYSLRIYQFLKYHQGMARVDKRKSVIVPLTWLREYLAINQDEYKLYGHFKSGVLVPVQTEIHDKTDLKFRFKEVKEGRKVEAIEFTWERNSRYNQLKLPIFENDGEPLIPPEDSKEDMQDESAIRRLMEFGLNRGTAEKVYADNTPGGIEETLNYITARYQNQAKKPIMDLRAFIAKVLGLPSGSILDKPKIQQEWEEQQELEQMRVTEEKREKEEKLAKELRLSKLKFEHEQLMTKKLEEFLKARKLSEESPELVKEFEASLSKERLKKYIAAGRLKSGSQMLDYYDFLARKFLPKEDLDFEAFLKNKVSEEEFDTLTAFSKETSRTEEQDF